MNSDGPSPSTPDRNIALTLSLAAVALAGVLPAVFALLPDSAQAWNFSVIGALGIFAGSRLGFRYSLGLILMALVCKDVSLYLMRGWHPYPITLLYFVVYAALGAGFLQRKLSVSRIGIATLSGSLGFFLISNFMAWVNQALPYGYSLQGLVDCYIAGLPFHRGTLTGDCVFTAGLFALYAAMVTAPASAPERVASPAEKPWR